PDLLGSADPHFRGDASLANPEELLLAALSSCHMLSYLALCARAGLRVVAYDDAADGALELSPDGGRIREVTLRPRVTIAGGPAGVSVLGGGAFAIDGAGQGVAHFLVAAAHVAAARAALTAAGLELIADREVVTTRLDQDRPGQLGGFCRRLADAGVNIEVLYS